jgi:2-polyprenyl-3-methyl-5-hydroxy-6-metoxy-1,4-benzoquinol methylase
VLSVSREPGKALQRRPALVPERLQWTPELVERFWNGIRQTRLIEFNFSRQAGKAFVLSIEHLLPPSGTVLDFGAGDGDLVALLLERGYRAAAYEPSEIRKKALATRFDAHPNFAGVVGSKERRSFDTVVLCEVIEHILDEDFDSVLRRIAQLTKAGGHVIVTTPNNEDLELGMCYDPVTNMMFHKWQHVRSFTAASLAQIIERYGFDELVTHQIGLDNNLFVPFDQLWGGASPQIELPSYITHIRSNSPGTIGTQSNLLYIGTRRA